MAGKFLRSQWLVGGRNMPGFFLLRTLLRQYFGKPTPLLMAEKSSSCGKVA